MMPRDLRQLLRMGDLGTEFLLACLWFRVSGSAIAEEAAIDWREVEACAPQPLWISLLVSIGFAFAIKVVVLIPVIIVKSFHTRHFMSVEESRLEHHTRRSLIFWN